MNQGFATMDFLLAAMPIGIFLFLGSGIKMPMAKASFCSMVTAVGIGAWHFGQTRDGALLELQKGGWNTFTIFLVVLSAMLLYEILERAHMFQQIQQKIERYIEDDTLQVLFVGWMFTSFLQSVTGFGVPVAVAAPILVKLGLKPVKAVAVAVIGHAWGGTFGTLALAWDGLLLQLPEGAAVNVTEMAIYTGLMLWIFNLLSGFAVAVIHRGKKLRGRDVAAVLVISLAQGGGQIVFSLFMPTTACFAACLLSMAAFLAVRRLVYRQKDVRSKDVRAVEKGEDSLIPVIFPFLSLTLIVAALLLAAPVNRFLGQLVVGLPVTDPLTGMKTLYSPVSILTHSCSVLLLTSVFTGFFYRKRGTLKAGEMQKACRAAIGKSSRAILPILFLVIMSKVMEGSGQIDALAEGIAFLAGNSYSFFAPFVGMLGSFISSSNMSSNILFSGFQYKISQLVSNSGELLLAAQTAGGSVGILMAAGNLVLGLSTAGESGKEGLVMMKLLPFGLAAGGILGLVTFALQA